MFTSRERFPNLRGKTLVQCIYSLNEIIKKNGSLGRKIGVNIHAMTFSV